MGTATYDHEGPRARQTRLFVEAGCVVEALDVAFASPSLESMAAIVDASDVIIISGGNTCYAVQRWTATGLKPLLRGAMDRGVVMAGGSAGAICWFDAGHSDSMDPDTYVASETPGRGMAHRASLLWSARCFCFAIVFSGSVPRFLPGGCVAQASTRVHCVTVLYRLRSSHSADTRRPCWPL